MWQQVYKRKNEVVVEPHAREEERENLQVERESTFGSNASQGQYAPRDVLSIPHDLRLLKLVSF